MQISIAECPAQEAIFRSKIPDTEEELACLEQLLTTNYVVPKACTSTATAGASASAGSSMGSGKRLEQKKQSSDSDTTCMQQDLKTDDFF